MENRTKTILEEGVRYFIKTGRPVTSSGLYELGDFGIKPAMIRWELNDLCEDGYFYQTHPSGGRYPSDKAYKFFVDSILEEQKEMETRESLHGGFSGFVEKFFQGERDVLIEGLAKHVHALSVGYEPKKQWTSQSGLKSLFKALALEDYSDVLRVVSDFESLGEHLLGATEMWESYDSWPQVFIGKSPITKSNCLSVVAHQFETGEGNMFLFIIGPKRMDYEKSIGILKSLEAFME